MVGSDSEPLGSKKGDNFTKEFSAGIKSYIPFTNICNNIKISENHFQHAERSIYQGYFGSSRTSKF
jgi:type I restriction enzyme, S subunit